MHDDFGLLYDTLGFKCPKKIEIRELDHIPVEGNLLPLFGVKYIDPINDFFKERLNQKEFVKLLFEVADKINMLYVIEKYRSLVLSFPKIPFSLYFSIRRIGYSEFYRQCIKALDGPVLDEIQRRIDALAATAKYTNFVYYLGLDKIIMSPPYQFDSVETILSKDLKTLWAERDKMRGV